ncbi:Ger(x)C family spore germination protein [Radiobacillus kanasensis]|uniref:Ger(x)C family spore germination protein n=1 Tax=Radiobacillus kanasensis TaxID=2844358 RepID=UPI001E477CC2|nr:Ger(x)C family spore germination protein [Radiobacillus kanasensis]UFU00614.1 Ger(x)C family spore germination protein [Radiobacillus kanasensis]
MTIYKRIYLLILCLFLLTGCWDRVEVNDLAFVTASGFDKLEENKLRTSVQVPLPGNMGGAGSSGGGGGSGGESPFYVDSGVGRNIRESNDDLQQRMSRKLYFSHRRVLVFGENIARGGFKKSLDVVIEQPQSRLSAYVLVTRGEAMEVLNATPHFEQFSAETMREMAKSGFGITVKDVMNQIDKPGKDPVIPIVETTKTENEYPEDQKDEIMISGAAILKDDKLKYFANKEESLGAFWLFEETPEKNYTFSVKEDGEINVSIDDKKIRTSYTTSGGSPSFSLTIDVQARVMQNEANLDLDMDANYQLAVKNMEKKIKQEINALLEHSMSEGIDVYGFGWYLFQHVNKQWEKKWADNWRNTLKEMKIDVNVNATIQQTTNPGITIKE